MEPDYLDIRLERRRQIFFGVLIALVIAATVIYYFWGNLINRGTILVYAEPPFVVEFYERNEEFQCDQSPCKITQQSGNKSFLVKKKGCETLFSLIDVKLWGTVEVEVELKMVPHFVIAETLPEHEEIEYIFVIDDKNKMQKMVRSDDDGQKAVVYFPKQLEKPEAFGNEKVALIVDRNDENSVYKVDILKGSKMPAENAPQFKNIVSGKWSNDGKLFAASILRQPNLWIMDESGNMEQTEIKANINLTAWLKDDKILLMSENILMIYNPGTKESRQVSLEEDFPEKPSEIISVNNGNGIYAKIGESFYQLILE